MSDPEELKRFDALLDTTVRASRLSGSKVQELIKLSVQLVEDDSHIVTTFFKLNRSLDSASPQRISSLYVFDAIAREARKLADKGVGREVKGSGGKGTQASLLLKMEGVVDSWVEGLLGDGKGGVWLEGKEKTRKIVDIWTKTSTFPQNTLDRLALRIANAQPRSTTPPYPPPLSVMSPALPPLDLPGNMTPLAQNGEGSHSSALPQTQATQPGQLPPELRKLLGLPDETTSIPNPAANNAGPSTSTSAAAAAAPAVAVAALPGLPPEIAALLAKTRPAPNPTTASAPGQPVPPATQGTQVAGLNLDLAQLAALTRLASASTSNTAASPPIPPHVPAPGPVLNLPPRPAGPFHPQQQQDTRPPSGHPSLPHPPPPPHVPHDQRYNGPPRRTYDERDRSPQRRPPLGGSGDRRQSGDRSRSPTKGFPGPAGGGPGGSGGRYPDRGPDRYDERPGPPGPPRMGFEPYTQQQRGDRAWSGPGPMPAGPPAHNNNNAGGRRRSHEFQPLPQKPSPSGGSGAGPTGRVPLPRMPSQGKDEFGRDILPPRPTLAAPTSTGQNDGEEDMALDDEDDQASPASAAASLPPPPPSAGLPTRPVPPAQAAPTGVGRPPGVPARPPPVNTSAPIFGGQPGSYGRPPASAPVSAPAGPAPGSGGLDTFDISTFNPASPEAWTALAKAFENSMGRQPNQMEMMAFLMGGGGVSGGGGGQGLPPGPNQGPGMGMGTRNGSMSSFGGGGGGGFQGPAARGRF